MPQPLTNNTQLTDSDEESLVYDSQLRASATRDFERKSADEIDPQQQHSILFDDEDNNGEDKVVEHQGDDQLNKFGDSDELDIDILNDDKWDTDIEEERKLRATYYFIL
jgi:hypothetical protein